MSREILRRSRARRDLEEIWSYIADDNESAADRMLERIDEILRMLRDRRPEDFDI
jgi:toxin ParE1/3/4